MAFGSEIQDARSGVWSSPLYSSVSSLSQPWFSHLLNGASNSTSLIRFL